MTPLIFKKTIVLPLPSNDDRRAHDQRLKEALEPDQIDIPLALLRRLPAFMTERGELACIIGRTDRGCRLIDIGKDRSYAVALDLGTTNMAALLYDNLGRNEVLVKNRENPQVAFGGDIMTRMHAALSDRTGEVYRSLLDGVNALIGDLCDEAGVDRDAVHAVTAAGNTVMTHFFLGLDIATIPVEPFVPVVRMPGFFTASELSLDINGEALVYVFPNAGSYVGGDIIAGIIASGMFRSDEISILIDVGTNAEVVIGNRDWMIAGAGAAGPALAEGICRIGRRAKSGIVYDVEIRDRVVSCRSFDRAEPRGICGTGMVSLLYELYRAGMIDRSGALLPGEQVTTVDGEPAFVIARECREALSVTQNEIHTFMKSKAAMFTLLLVLTRAVGISFGDVRNVYVSGALGTGMNAKKAVGIGMLPAWPAGIVQALGNSSLAGARMLLADGGLLKTIGAVVEKITYKPMQDDPEFMKEYLGAVFIPHTNPELLRVAGRPRQENG